MKRFLLFFIVGVGYFLCVVSHAQDSTYFANKRKIEALKARLGKLSGEESAPGQEEERLKQIIQQQRDTIKWLMGIAAPEKVHYENSVNAGPCDCIRIYYDLGKYTANYMKYPRLDSIALLAKSDETLFIKLVGHADTKGNIAANEALAVKRAHDLKVYLTRKYQIRPERIITDGNGSRDLIEELSDPYLFHLNRRVEVSIERGN